MCCGTSSLWVRFALALIIIGFIFETVGFATATWMFNNTSGETRVGLWISQTCSGSVCTDSEVPSSYKDDKFRATQAVEILAFILYVIAPFLIGAFVFFEATRNQRMVIVCMVVCFVIGALLGAGMIVWMVYVQSQAAFSAGYSMGLTILGGILAVFAGLLFIPETGEDYEFDDRVVKARGATPQYSRHHSSRRVNVRSISPSDDSSRGSTPDYHSSRQTRKTYDSMPSPMDTPKTYDSMPVPMSQTVYDDGVSTGRNFRPPTYNDVSGVTLQRDRVGI
ncbi:uncharacterized protein LOC110449280 [Mizuhopecten yessoensis]|uniref:Uncharacterized protein n=1 Tax=Mizuhopecten yessoensis TaxID=6573 RepID=A0A210QRK8_MIZYE|nr:uncharacterized protein LOC110449280 [Mizuhopecten yessoensis]OWF51372.1 hypothetical protein KP79_PYT14645 [Mizuhopecten yessoensis]